MKDRRINMEGVLRPYINKQYPELQDQAQLPINEGQDLFLHHETKILKQGGLGKFRNTLESLEGPSEADPYALTARSELSDITNLGQQQLRSRD
jgi:hypothetical protein